MSLKSKFIIQSLVSPVFTKLTRLFPNIIFPISDLDKPLGPLCVGTSYVEFCNDERGHKRISGKVWYPAMGSEGFKELVNDHLFNSDANKLIETINGTDSKIIERLSKISSNSLRNAQVIECEKSSLPVVIFSHGFGMMLNSNITLFEYLASYGFVVFSIGHAEFSTLVEFKNGESIPFNSERSEVFTGGEMLQKVMPILNAETLTARRDATKIWSSVPEQVEIHEEWVSTIVKCIDSLENHNVKIDRSELVSKLNLNQLSLIGMSFGGSASALAAHRDVRVKSAINLDGGQVGLDLFDKNINKPLLVLQSNDVEFKTPGTFNEFHYENFASNLIPVERYTIDGASHNDFTDLTLLKGYLAKKFFMLGKKSGKDLSHKINSLVLDFLIATLDKPNHLPFNLAEFREKYSKDNTIRREFGYYATKNVKENV